MNHLMDKEISYTQQLFIVGLRIRPSCEHMMTKKILVDKSWTIEKGL